MQVRRKIAAVLVVGLALAAAPSGAAPISEDGAPTVYIDVESTDDPFTFLLTARAMDPDGEVLQLQLCPGVGDECRLEAWAPVGGPIRRARTCLSGTERSMQMTVRYPAEGRYTVGATARGGGCRPLTQQATVNETTSVYVVGPLPPIVCPDEATPTASDVGVHEDSIDLAMVTTSSGTFANDADAPVRRVIEDVNRAGGICGRRLNLTIVDDGGDGARSRQYVRTLIHDGAFALVSMPSRAWQGAISSGDIDAAGIPTVGTGGLDPAEFTSERVWPVGSSAKTFADVVVRRAYANGARRFGLVRDGTIAYATEVAQEMQAIIDGLDGAELVDQDLIPSRASYSAETESFNGRCGDGCDEVVWVLEAPTALTWAAGGAKRGTLETSAWPRLFSERFVVSCGARCDGLMTWLDFEPPVGDYPTSVERYRNVAGPDALDRDAEAAYQGVLLAAHAIAGVGTNLTRAGLQAALDEGSFYDGLTGGALGWGSARGANRWMRAYSAVLIQGSFAGWRGETDWIEQS